MSKRILSLVLTLALVLGSFSMAFAETGATTAGLTPAEKIAKLQELLFVEGDENGNLNLDKSIKRSEVAVIAAKAAFSGGSQDMDAVTAEIKKLNYAGQFSDVKQSDWANAFVNAAVSKGIISGYPDGTFKPAKDIKYKEVITMMVGLAGEQPNEGKYPGNYITKAMELGLLDGVDVDYEAVAQRQGVFEILFNTVTQNKVGNYNIDKVIVLENNRVESIGANELVVEVIKQVQRANFVDDSRSGQKAEDARGEQLRITVPASAKLDVEGLLGKVVDLSYDKQMNAVNAQEDKSYEYKSGSMELLDNKLTVDGKTYTVSKDERKTSDGRYQNTDDRVFNTYVNNEAFSYDNAVSKFAITNSENKKETILDFGRVTIKNGKVLFIDAFNFNDIAPVKAVKEDGKKTEIKVYNDVNDGGEKTIELKDEKVLAFNKGSFTKIDKADIKATDVIHIGEDTKKNLAVVVRTDSQVDGEYTKVVEYKKDNKVVVVVADKEYEILNASAKRPVYAYDSKEFRRLDRKDASNVLKEFIKEEVSILQDVNGNLQYLGAKIEFGEFVGMVDRIVGKEARLLKSNNTKSDYTTTLNSKLGTSSTGHQNLGSYAQGNLVFVGADKEVIDTMKLLSNTTTGNTVTAIDKNSKDISVGTTKYRTFDRTNVFVRTTNASGAVDQMYATTLGHVEKNAKLVDANGVAMQAIVITDTDYNNMNPRRDFEKGAKDANGNLISDSIANTIIFTVIDLKAELDREYVEVVSIINKTQKIEVKNADGKVTTLDVEKDSDAYKELDKGTINKKDILEIGVTKGDNKAVKEINKFAATNMRTGKVAVGGYNERNKTLKLDGNSTTFTWSKTNFADFVTGNVEDSKVVTVYLKDGYVVAVGNAVSGEGTDTRGEITDIKIADGSFVVEGRNPHFLNIKSVLKDVNGYVLKTGIIDIVNYLTEGDRVEVTTTDGVMTVKYLEKSGKQQYDDKSIATKAGLNRLKATATTIAAGETFTIDISKIGNVTLGATGDQAITVNGTLVVIEGTNEVTLGSGLTVNGTVDIR